MELARLKKLRSYILRLSSNLSSGKREEHHRILMELVAQFFSNWKESGKTVKPGVILISWEEKSGFLHTIRNFGRKSNDISFLFGEGSVFLFSVYFLPSFRNHLVLILQNLFNLQVLESVTVSHEIFTEENLEAALPFIELIKKFPSITSISYTSISGYNLGALLLFLIDIPFLTRLSAVKEVPIPNEIRRHNFNVNNINLSELFELMIADGKSSSKPVILDIPFDPLLIPKVVQIFPNVQGVGIWDESVPPEQFDSILNDLLDRYSKLDFDIFTLKPPSTYQRLVESSGNRVKVSSLQP